MATVTQIRGGLLEESILFLLRKVGYQTYDPGTLRRHLSQDMRAGKSGLDVRGRGAWHQIDAFALWTHSPAFMYPLRLMVEAKCYASHRPVGLEVPRNCVGVLKDLSENYFSYSRNGLSIRGPRFNYTAAVFSTSGYTRGAVEYAVAHQVFLIQYSDLPVMQPLIDAILTFDERCVSLSGQRAVSIARAHCRRCLDISPDEVPRPPGITEVGHRILTGAIAESCHAIRGSYFGMLQGQWPLHLLKREPLPAAAFERDEIHCRVSGNDRGEWKFVPIRFDPGHPAWFELEFSLPSLVAELVKRNREDPIAVANIKQRHFSYIDLTGVIGGIRRNVRLVLDKEWIEEYVYRRHRHR